MKTTTFTPDQTYTKFEEELNWLEYQNGVALNPMLKQYAESEIDKYLISASDLMGLNTLEFIEYLERIMAISYGMGYDDYDEYEYENPQPSRVIYPPIPKQWVRGLARKIIDWAINLAYVNGMLDN